jgi:ubiquinone/menaquinone biosynthesis C-methylase UbiE
MLDQPEVYYALGHAEGELRRLIRQSAFYGELTENLLRSAGISEGMRVLDIGCGPGCVSLMAARLVGPSGTVVGLDRSPEALAVARKRADTDQFRHVEFIQGDLADMEHTSPFDALIGRFVLMYLPNPSTVLQKLAQYVRSGGLIVFQEMDIAAARSVPDMPMWQKYGTWIQETFQRANVDIQMGPKLYNTFRQAGLPAPKMNLHARIGGGEDFTVCEYIADIVASLLPMMDRFGVVSAATIEIGTLAARLREEMVNYDGVMIPPPLVGAWARLPA